MSPEFLNMILKKINFSNILNTTQKTLNIVNQAIPLVYQVKPIVTNAKTIFKIIGAVKNDGNTKNRTFNQSRNNIRETNSTNKQTLAVYDYDIKNTNEPKFLI